MKSFMKFILIFLLLIGIGFTASKYQSLSEQSALNSLSRANWMSVSQGNFANLSTLTKFGGNRDIDGASEVLWTYGGSFTIPTGGQTLSIVSSSTADDYGGTGANTLLILGLDENYEPVSLTVNMDGTTPVVTTQKFAFINRAAVYLSGTGKVNAGNITITQATSGYVLAYIDASAGVTQQLVYQVPAGYRGYFKDLAITAAKIVGGGNPEILVQVKVYSFTTNTTYVIREFYLNTAVANHILIPDFKAEPVYAKEIVWVEASTDTANTTVYGSMSGFLEEL